MKEIVITKQDEGKRIDKYVRKILSNAPLSFIYKLFRNKDVKINNKRVDISYILKENDVLRIYITDKQLEEFNKPNVLRQVKYDLDIIYEDENILIVNKPRGILIHGDINEKRITFTNQVLNYLHDKGEYNSDDNFTPSPAHRLDRNTSGIVVFGKKIKILQELYELFKNRECISKYYTLLVNGYVKQNGIIDYSLLKDEKKGIVYVSKYGKTSITKYKVLECFSKYTLLEAELVTGRTHQLRVHFAEFKHPICGDSKYGDYKTNKKFEKEFDFQNQFLHAKRIVFRKIDGELSYLSDKEFVAKLPKEEEFIIKELRRRKNVS